jgi:hypothetical protein
MTLVVKRREITDPGQLQALVVDNVDAIEPGLLVLDSRLLLGQATIDVVGLDAHGALVLMALGLTADEEMLLKAVEAYSWCLEYPEAIRRLYPAAQVSSSQPPRLMFVIERMPDSFHRKIKQLGFPEVDCVELRSLEVDGTPAVCFDTLARLRRGPVAATPVAERPVTPAAPVPTGRPTSLKLQKLLGADRPGAVREPAQVVSMMHRTAPRVETSKGAGIAPKMESAAAPRLVAVVEPAFVVAPIVAPQPEPVVTPAAALDPVLSIAPELEPSVVPIATTEAAAEPVLAPEPIAQIVEEPVVATATPELVAVTVEPVVESIVAPEPMVAAAPESTAVASEPEAPSLSSEPELTLASIAEPEPEAASITSEPELTVDALAEPELQIATPEPEPSIAPVLELDPSPTIQAPEPVLELEPSPTIQEPLPVLELEPSPTIQERQPVLTLAVERVAAAPEPQVTEVAPAPIAPPVTQSVFARRPADPVAAPAEPRVSFADAAKDLLAVTNPTPRTEAAATIQRPSVEEMTRAALDDLVGSTKPTAAAEEKTTAFAKAAGAFSKPAAQKRPRTIAPPPADPQPIAGGSKLGTAPKRTAPAAPAATAHTTPAPIAQPEATPSAPPQGFEGLQFPNDGVLTRQWMEFLNQMAAGK